MNRVAPPKPKEKRYLTRAGVTGPDSHPPWSGFNATPDVETWPPMQWTREEIVEEEESLPEMLENAE